MGVINWLLFRNSKVIAVEIPNPIHYALQTYKHMQNTVRSEDDQLREDDIVTLALAEYFQRNLYTNVIENVHLIAEAKSRDVPFSSAPDRKRVTIK